MFITIDEINIVSPQYSRLPDFPNALKTIPTPAAKTKKNTAKYFHEVVCVVDKSGFFVYVHIKIAIAKTARPIMSAAVIFSFHTIRLTNMEIGSELLPIRVVTDTEPVLMAAVLNRIKQVCVRP